ncbi:MAG: N-acetylmuramoyl-L-alanine amidase [Spirochaetales bacterium]
MPTTRYTLSRRLNRLCFLLLAATVFVTVSEAQESDQEHSRVATFASELGARLEYDPFLGIGRVTHGGVSVRFAVGSDRMYVDDGRELKVEPPEGRNGNVYLTEETVERLRKVWRPSATDRDEPYVAAIFIDPGHGGRDPGTIGRHEVDGESLVLQEKDIVLDVSLDLRDKLQSSFPDRNIVLSRDEDVYLSLDERTEMANEIPLGENEYIVFVSIHANASFNTRAQGFEAWYLPPEQRRTLIDPEELDEDRRRIHAILNSMREEEVSVQSAMLGTSILEGMENSVGEQSPNRGLLQENWAVVRNALMPSILVELGFVSNTEEALLLNDERYLNKLTDGLYNGISEFIELFEASETGGT